jgi:hypothetical protein
MLSAPAIIAQSELLMAIPRSAVAKMTDAATLKVFELPFEVPPFEVKIYSHKRASSAAQPVAEREAEEWAATERT